MVFPNVEKEKGNIADSYAPCIMVIDEMQYLSATTYNVKSDKLVNLGGKMDGGEDNRNGSSSPYAGRDLSLIHI